MDTDKTVTKVARLTPEYLSQLEMPQIIRLIDTLYDTIDALQDKIDGRETGGL